ncbi:hypothetical protein ACTXG7_24870 [Mycolicibacterium sp. Dal123E01]|uniref:hypothetical protein n=1 Tax=Mycolicibacterium sp. Dal123E01 TaxID=3457578 RepID=UPI00403E6CA0
MTLILIAANKDFIVQVSDRRTTSVRGVESDEETKAIYLETPYMQALMGYTGLARIGIEPTNRILMDLLLKEVLRRADGNPSRVVHELGAALDNFFQNGPGRVYRVRDRGLTVAITAFVGREGGLRQAFLTNTKGGVFRPVFSNPKRDAPDDKLTIVQRLGQWQEFDQNQAEEVRTLLAPGRPARAVRDKMAEIIANRANTNQTVGAQLNTAVLQRGQQPAWGYVTGVNSPTYYSGDMVIMWPDGKMLATSDMQITNQDRPMVVPRVHRNAPCPCGNGKRYRECHRPKAQ